MKLNAVGLTDIGLKRGHNEDNYLLVDDHRLFMVADGMGGHNAGEVASRLAVETVAGFFDETTDDDDVTWPYRIDRGQPYEANRFATAVKLANLRIHEGSANTAGQKGMGTTLVGIHFNRRDAVIAHVGDSRVYRMRNGSLSMLTEDHSLLNDYIRMKDLSPEEIQNFPHKNVIVRALGMRDSVQVDVILETPQAGDIYLLCSDGLTGMIEDPDIERIMRACGTDLDACTKHLIRVANENGGVDNITAVLIHIVSMDPA